MARLAYRLLRQHILQRIIPLSRKKFKLQTDQVIEVIGFFESYTGIGESARLCAVALQKAGYAVRCRSVEAVFRKPKDSEWRFDNCSFDKEVSLRIFHINPPMMPPVILSLGLKNFLSTYNVGYWAWELESIPSEWQKATKYINAIFTPSEFTSEAIRRYTCKPVITVLHPVVEESVSLSAPAEARSRLVVADDTFLVSTIFSFGSAMERKNPQAVIKTFQHAFSPVDNALLILKSNSATDEQKSDLRRLFGEYKNIRLYDDLWTRDETRGLVACSDLYLSLHRSEGFGLTIAEAMTMKTPVMVTNYSGNAGFCDEENSFLIDYNLIPVVSDHPEFKGLNAVMWADANTEQAGTMLARLYSNRSILKSAADVAIKTLGEKIHENSYCAGLRSLSENTRALSLA
ncbi:MAG TPA: glycosyltransferase [Micavibrio sp.]|nr:glycosyltransferase [Micavibrio sp.]